MPEDNFMECIAVIAETMKGTGWDGQWYGKCFATKNVPSTPAIYVCFVVSCNASNIKLQTEKITKAEMKIICILVEYKLF